MKLLIVAFFVVNIFTAQSQNKNYLVKNTGDSVYGEIRLSGKQFIVLNKSGKTEVNADNVRFVQSPAFKGTVVVHCRLHLYTDNLSDLQLGPTPIRETDTVMVLREIYSTPKMNLYFGTDNLKTQYYFYKTPQNETPVQLVVRFHLDGGLGAYSNNVAAYRGEKSRVHIEEDKGYVNQLKFIMKDCTTISEGTWDILQYRDYSFKNLIKKYNECK